MEPIICLCDQVFLRTDRICRVDGHVAAPMFVDANRCELITPTYNTRSIITLANGMQFYSCQCCQEISSAIVEAQADACNTPVAPVAISNRITLDPAYVVAVLPYNPQINRYAEEYGYTVHSYCYVPQSLIILDDGDTCLAVKDTPAELMDKFSQPRQG